MQATDIKAPPLFKRNAIVQGSYLIDYNDAKDDFFTVVGEEVAVYFGDVDYTNPDVWEGIEFQESAFRNNK